MACLNITNGLFINAGPNWQTGTAPVTTANGATITNTTSGPNPGCAIVKGGDSEFFAQPSGGSVRFIVFGNPANFVAVLTIVGGIGPVLRSVVLVDVSGASIETELILQVSAPSTSSLPAIDPSQGNGSVFLLTAPDASSNVHCSIHRSADGDTLCSAVPFAPTQQVVGEATATQLLIKHGGTTIGSCARPRGVSQVSPDPVPFPDAVLGVGVDPTLASSTRVATIRNDGTDCLTINGVGGAGPYSIVSASPALPVTLDPGADVDVTIRFAPSAIGTFDLDLPISPAPTSGDTMLRCRGKARAPNVALGFAGSLAFGAVPLTSSSTRTLTIANTGERAVNVLVPASPAGSAFVWPSFSGSILPGVSAPGIVITFTPAMEGAFTQPLTFTSDAPGTPHTVNLSGTGCVPRARIVPVVPPGPNIGFGQIQRGFRTVRVVRVQNTGNGPLSFRARIAGSALFGIQRDGGSITSPQVQELFTVPPMSMCGAGATGSGEVLFAVTFFADATPGLQSGQLVIDNHNGQFGAPASFTFDLEAEVIAVINADVELVLDRSGSMTDSSGPRRKIDVALDAARLFVQLARPDVDDRVGTSRFNTVPEQVQTITPITSGNQASLISGLVEPNFSPAGGTAIAGGVIQAVTDMTNNVRPVVPPMLRKAIVVLTDANDNTAYTNPADGESYTLLGEGGTRPVAVPADVRLYGVGIGDAVDTGRLAQLCPATGGQFLHVHDFSGLDFFKLEKHFTQIYMETVDLAQISDPTYVIQPFGTHEHQFTVLRGDVTFMVVIFDRDGVRLPFWLRSPSGEIVELTTIPSGFQIRPGMTDTARFMEVRLPQGEPDRYAGAWHVVVRHDGKQCVASGAPGAAVWQSAAPAVPTALAASTHAPNGIFGFTSGRCKPNTTDPVMYGIALGAASNFRMYPFIEPGIVSVGESIRLNATVSEFSLPVLGCTVTVDAKAPDGTVRTLSLLDDGLHDDGAGDDGDYGGRFVHTYQEGTYEFLYRARGQSRDGEPVVREATLSKYVQGRDKLVPPASTGNPDGSQTRCCSLLERWLRILTILLVILILIALTR